MRITGVEVSASDQEIINYFKGYGYNVFENTYTYEESCYHNTTKTLTRKEWVIEHPTTKKLLPMRKTFNKIVNKHLNVELLSGLNKEFVALFFNE